MGSPEHAVASPAKEAFGEKRRRQWQQGEPERLGSLKRTAEQPELGGTQGSSSPALERGGLRGAGGVEQPGVSGAVGWWLLRELSCSGGTKLLSQHLVAARLSLYHVLALCCWVELEALLLQRKPRGLENVICNPPSLQLF